MVFENVSVSEKVILAANAKNNSLYATFYVEKWMDQFLSTKWLQSECSGTFCTKVSVIYPNLTQIDSNRQNPRFI